ncbi:MAG TPA: hypothetical protein VHV82_09430 [Sporichthyaceae bacterium]|jgi:hypothetical protein|nr:hypothetical protein [Sporichthyaceae bacterium]
MGRMAIDPVNDVANGPAAPARPAAAVGAGGFEVAAAGVDP